MSKYAVVLIAFACVSCATTPDQTAQAREEKVYRTGSMVPVKDPNAPSEVKTLEPAMLGGQISGSKTPQPSKGLNGG